MYWFLTSSRKYKNLKIENKKKSNIQNTNNMRAYVHEHNYANGMEVFGFIENSIVLLCRQRCISGQKTFQCKSFEIVSWMFYLVWIFCRTVLFNMSWSYLAVKHSFSLYIRTACYTNTLEYLYVAYGAFLAKKPYEVKVF